MLKTNKKILGIDYGDKSIGLSLYDIETDFFSPYKTIYRERKNISEFGAQDNQKEETVDEIPVEVQEL